MASFFESSNPTLSERIFQKSLDAQNAGTMTVRGSIQKFGFLLLMVIAGAAYNWKMLTDGKIDTMMTLFWVGLIGGLISGVIITFKPTTAKWISPVYGLLEGLALGALSAIVNAQFAAKAPNIVLQAVAGTFAVALSVFLLYNFRIIKPTEKFKAVIISASVGVGLFYLVYFVLFLFHVNIPFMSWTDSSPLGIGINLVVIVIAALSLVLDFERLEIGEQMGAPKEMEWYGAFALMVTMVWLYIQILKLLSRFASSRN